ncbi:MAG: hypothetical protein CVT74_11215 [Alphaproteobacteria bacterium HGW-Alphaproteobacteria-13]|jgi:glutathione S-transferase|nr:MAG: hypothetical protein CVT74_11215 [Alphaproteobacteria bacterium HGW-Alphaproteobacteria-13]
MITLYQFPTSPFCEKIRRILHFKRIAFSIVDVPRVAVADYASVSPNGKFPAIDHDGQAVQDSTDIAHYIERHFPTPPLIPEDPREAALCHVIEDWADESLYFYELVMRLGWESNAVRSVPAFARTMPGLSDEEVLSRLLLGVRAITQPQGLGRKAEAEIVADVERHIAALNAMLEGRDWLAGSRISLADIAVTSQIQALRGAQEATAIIDSFPRIGKWEERVAGLAPA